MSTFFFFLISTLLISSTSIFYSNILQYFTFVLFVSSDQIACSACQRFLSQPYLKWSWESAVIKPISPGLRRSLFRLEFSQKRNNLQKMIDFCGWAGGKNWCVDQRWVSVWCQDVGLWFVFKQTGKQRDVMFLVMLLISISNCKHVVSPPATRSPLHTYTHKKARIREESKLEWSLPQALVVFRLAAEL